MRADEDTGRGERPDLAANEGDEVLGLSNDPVLRRSWLLYQARKYLPFDQAIDWARRAEQFITGSSSDSHPASSRALLHSGGGSSRRGGAGIRDPVLQLIKDNPAGLSRGEILQRLDLKGDKAGETSVSNALTALVKKKEVTRRGRKYRVE